MLASIVDCCSAILCDRYLDLIYRTDYKCSIFNLKLYIGKVLIVVMEIASFQLHVIGSNLCSLNHCISIKTEVALFVQLIADGLHLISGYNMLVSIVDCCSAILYNCYLDLIYWTDYKCSILNCKLYIGKVLIVVMEITSFQLHVISSSLCSLNHCVSIKTEVALFVQLITDGLHGISVYGMLASIVDCCSTILYNCYSHFSGIRSNR